MPGPFKGVGVQWAGKGALEKIHEEYPKLTIRSSEQECGNGSNDWHYARYGGGLMQKYFRNGAGAWQYWKLALPADRMRGWEWPQNALVSVDTAKGAYRLTHDHWLMRHLGAHVQIGARYLPTATSLGYDNALAFSNPNGDVVLVMFNEMADPLPLVIGMGKQQLALPLPADTFSTILIPARQLQA